MQQKVYVDTSTLILFTKINELPLLKLVHGIVYITIQVANELGYINSIKPLLNKINKTNFRLSKEVYLAALRIAGEWNT